MALTPEKIALLDQYYGKTSTPAPVAPPKPGFWQGFGNEMADTVTAPIKTADDVATGFASGVTNTGAGLLQRLNEVGGDTVAGFYRHVLPMIRPDLADQLQTITPEDVNKAISGLAQQNQTLANQNGPAFKVGQVAGEVAPVAAAGSGMGLIAGGAAGGAAAGFLQPTQAPTTDASLKQAATNALEGGALGAVAGPLVGLAGKVIGKGVNAIADYIGGGTGEGLSKAEKLVINSLGKQGKTPEEIQAILQDTGQGDIARTLPEIADNQKLLQYQKRLTQNPGDPGSVMKEFNDERFQNSIPQGIQQFIENISTTTTPDIAGKNVADAANTVVKEAIEGRAKKASPLYAQAYQQVIPEDKFGPLLEDSNIAKAYKDVTSSPLYKTEMSAYPENSVGYMDLTKRRLDDMIESAKRNGANNEARILMGANQKLKDTLNVISPMWKAGREIFASESGTVNGITDNLTGALSELNNGEVAKASQLVFKSTPQQITKASDLIRSANPQAWDDMLASHISSEFEKSTSTKGFLSSISKNSIIKNKYYAAMTPEQRTGFDMLVKNLDEATKVSMGSDTAQNFATDELMQSELGPRVIKEVTSNKGLTARAIDAAGQIVSHIDNRINNKSYTELAQLFTSPDAVALGQKLAKMNPGSPSSLQMVANYLSPSTASAVGNINSVTGARPVSSLTPEKKALIDAYYANQAQNKTGNQQPQQPVSVVPVTPTAPANDVISTISNAGQKTGVNPQLLTQIASTESGLNPNAQNPASSASGLFQFTDQTWKDMVNKYGKNIGITENDKNDPEANALMGALFTRDNQQKLTDSLKRPPTPGELYMAHFLGAGGALKLIRNQNNGVIAAKLFREPAKANKTIFFEGKRPRTTQEVYRILNKKVG